MHTFEPWERVSFRRTYVSELNGVKGGKGQEDVREAHQEVVGLAAKKAGDHSMELIYKLKGKTTETDKYEVSADGKTLTQTVTYAGVSKPEVDVYDRE